MLNERNKFYFLLFVVSALMSCIVLTAETSFDMSDGVQHYLISRYSWQHPLLFLDHWGKPFFILLSSPFAQFGLKGIAIFNVLCGSASAYFLYRVAEKSKLEHTWLLPVFIFFAPIYFAVVNSGLTEPLFGAVLTGAIFLFTDKKYTTSTLLISFLPFVRSEGYLILPAFAFVFLIRKKYAALPLLSFGWLVYAFVGWLALGDFMWQFTQNPYRGAAEVYGHGELLHFLNALKNIWGILLFWLFVLGTIIITVKSITALRRKIFTIYFLPEELFLIAGSFLIYFTAHSIFWWKGIYGSLGLTRVIAAVMPCAAYLTLVATNGIVRPIKSFVWVKRVFFFGITSITVIIPFKQHWPYKLENEQLLTKQVGEWFTKQNFESVDIYYLLPYFSIAADIDPFAENRKNPWKFNVDNTNGVIKKNTLLIWDGHFGPNELGIDLQSVLNNPEFELLQKFVPDEPIKTLNDYDFEIYVFRKR